MRACISAEPLLTAAAWLHFIPVQIGPSASSSRRLTLTDYSDMWHVLAFFRGGVHGEMSHDALAKEIALAGRDWATKYFVRRRCSLLS